MIKLFRKNKKSKEILYFTLLLQKFPELNPAWPVEIQDKWWGIYRLLLEEMDRIR